MSSVSVVPVIDTSTNMASSGVSTSDIQIAVTAFLGSVLAGDAIGVVNFDTAGNVAYGPNNQVAIVDSNLDQVTPANNAVNALTFTGTCTDIGGGLQTAYGMFTTSGAPSLQGAVLLTPGIQSCGTDPLTLSSYVPTYACAVGASADQTLVQQIATLSNGQFYAMATDPSITSVLATIRGAQTGTTTVVNAYQEIATQDFWLQPATIASGSSEAQFVVVWENTAFTYTSSSNPGPSEVSITIVQPPGITLTAPPTTQGAGFVVFDVTSPASGPGSWYVQIMYPGTVASLLAATAVFELSSTSTTALPLALEAPRTVQAGQPVHITAGVTDGDEPVRGLRTTAEIVAPRMGVDRVLSIHRDQLATVTPPPEWLAAGVSEERARLQALRESLLPEVDILGHRTYRMPLVAEDDGRYGLTIADTRERGGYLVKVHVQGYAERSATPFERTSLVSFFVE